MKENKQRSAFVALFRNLKLIIQLVFSQTHTTMMFFSDSLLKFIIQHARKTNSSEKSVLLSYDSCYEFRVYLKKLGIVFVSFELSIHGDTKEPELKLKTINYPLNY